MFGAIGLIGGLLSTGLQIYGAQQQGKAALAAANYNNALAAREASNYEQETAENIRRARINNRRSLSTLRLRQAGSGTLTTSGSTAAVLADAAGTFEVAIADAARSANLRTAALRQQGQMGMFNAQQQRKAANLQSFGLGLSGLTTAASTAYSNYQVGSR
jgi:hypothetical protein